MAAATIIGYARRIVIRTSKSRSAASVSSTWKPRPRTIREVSTSFESQLGPKFESRTTKTRNWRLVTNSLLTGNWPSLRAFSSFLGVGFSVC